jgi:hypothetical protein
MLPNPKGGRALGVEGIVVVGTLLVLAVVVVAVLGGATQVPVVLVEAVAGGTLVPLEEALVLVHG